MNNLLDDQEDQFEFSPDEMIFMDMLNLPLDILAHQSFVDKILIMPKKELNMVFLNGNSAIYSCTMSKKEEFLNEEIWYSNMFDEILQVIIVSTPLEALYYERLNSGINKLYIAIPKTTDENMQSMVSFLKQNFDIDNLNIKICLPNCFKSFLQELDIIKGLTGQKVEFKEDENILEFKSNDIKKIEEIKKIFYKIKETLNLEEIKNNFAQNDLVTLINDENITKIRFLSLEQLKKQSRKIILSLAKSLSFLHNIEVERPPRTNKKDLKNWEVINNLYHPKPKRRK